MIDRALTAALCALIRFYQTALSPLMGKNCRFHPTCSRYAQDALSEYGFLQGGWLGLKRICKCHPFYKGPFYDPVSPALSREPKAAIKPAESNPQQSIDERQTGSRA